MDDVKEAEADQVNDVSGPDRLLLDEATKDSKPSPESVSAPLEMKIVEEVGRYSPEVEAVMKLAFDRKTYMREYMRRYRARKRLEREAALKGVA
jgi:hypothetical protein